jgi:glyoxylase-like metal-dependent hydrolase (beta-lactamase superfamily II)
MTQQEWLMGRLLHIDSTPETIANTAEFYRRAAVEPEHITQVEDRGSNYSRMVTTIPRRFNRLEDDERVNIGGREWRVITGQGHAPEHMCLYCPDLRVIFTGDHILPRITPIIGVQPLQPDENPLANYIQSFTKFEGLPADVLALPAHNLPFRGLHTRLAHMRRHHRERLEELYDAASQPITARQGVDVLFSYRKLDSQDIRLATMETLSHAHYLVYEGRLKRTRRADGVWEFKRA